MDEFRREFLQQLDGLPPRNRDARAAEEATIDDPQTAEQYRRRCEFDVAVADAMEQVPLPLGLAARLAASLDDVAALEAETLADRAALQPAAVPLMASATAVETQSRRSWLISASSALASTAAGGALFVWWQNRRRSDLSVEQVLEASLLFHQRAAAKRGEAQPESLSTLPAEFPRSRFVTPHAEPRVRQLDEPLLGRAGAVYELAPAGEPRASLYVVSERPGLAAPAVPNLANAPLAHPFKTGGCAMSAWREENRIVLLVVDGDERRYAEYLAAPQEFA